MTDELVEEELEEDEEPEEILEIPEPEKIQEEDQLEERSVFEQEAPPTEALGFDDLVDQVLAGEWGTGQDRRNRLAKAGFDHRLVQAEIVRRANHR